MKYREFTNLLFIYVPQMLLPVWQLLLSKILGSFCGKISLAIVSKHRSLSARWIDGPSVNEVSESQRSPNFPPPRTPLASQTPFIYTIQLSWPVLITGINCKQSYKHEFGNLRALRPSSAFCRSAFIMKEPFGLPLSMTNRNSMQHPLQHCFKCTSCSLS